MPLAYENATSGENAARDLQKVLNQFGCDRFGTMVDRTEGVLYVEFSYRGRAVRVRASIHGYAAAWLKEHPYNSRSRMSKEQHERKAFEVGSVAVYSVLRDWIKGQVTAIETGIVSFDGAFLGNLLLPSGKTVMEDVEARKMLPPMAALPAPHK